MVPNMKVKEVTCQFKMVKQVETFCKKKRTYLFIAFSAFPTISQKTYRFPKQALVFTCLQSFEKTVGKREIARNEQLLLFP